MFDLKTISMKDKVVIFVILFFIIITFGSFTLFYTFGVDTELAILAEESATEAWISQGRFGIGIAKKIFNTNPIIPARNTILALVGIIINCFCIRKIIKKSKQ